MTTILLFIAVLGILVLVHELGHFIAAKKAGCDVEEFAIGFPPRLFSIKKNETNYSINLLPLGGYVKIKGENGGDLDNPNSFVHKSFAKKSLIISAGVLMNVFLGYVLITTVLILGTPTIVSSGDQFSRFSSLSDQRIQIIETLPDSPAAQAGIQLGDTIIDANNTAVASVGELSEIINAEPGKSVDIQIKRGDELLTTKISPIYIQEIDKYGIGVGLAEVADISYAPWIAPFIGIERTVEILWLILSAFASMIGELFTSGTVQADIAGPVGIAVLTGQVAEQGMVQLLQFTALLSLNLAIINIIPFPALDGGRLFLVALEKLRKKKLKPSFENLIHVAGFATLILLIIAVTAKDITTYGGGIWSSITNFF